jgi:tRNA (guanine6-N2)-methyltransferase
MARNANPYLLHVVPGLEGIAEREIRERVARTEVSDVLRSFDERTSLLIVRSPSPPGDLLRARTVEDVFVLVVDESHVPAGRHGLAVIRRAVAGSSLLEAAVSSALSVRPKRKGKVTFRVIARKAGTHSYRRVDMQTAVERVLAERFPAWRLVEDDAWLEIWVSLVGERFLAGIRLSDHSMRQRDYRAVSLPAALKPTIAAAMVQLTGPAPQDVFLDPMCGSGTILIERALAGRYQMLLGCDRDPAAVAATRENIGPRYKPIEIHRWDAADLPLEDGWVSALATNLPFGKQIGSREENRRLYPALLKEWVRVVRPGGRLVLLTSERELLRQSLRRQEGLIPHGETPVLVRGVASVIFSVLRADV